MSQLVAAGVVDQEDPEDLEDPQEAVRRYPSSRSITRTVAMETMNSATKQETVSARKKRVISKVRSIRAILISQPQYPVLLFAVRRCQFSQL